MFGFFISTGADFPPHYFKLSPIYYDENDVEIPQNLPPVLPSRSPSQRIKTSHQHNMWLPESLIKTVTVDQRSTLPPYELSSEQNPNLRTSFGLEGSRFTLRVVPPKIMFTKICPLLMSTTSISTDIINEEYRGISTIF